ncbi:MAG: hypothetical protein J6S71_01455 [Clostridia bacterium]|nr:hypothetical protein [Clostridia bacterium]
MGIFFELLISLFFGMYYFLPTRAEALNDQLNRLTYNVFKEKNRKTLLLIMSIINCAFLAVIIVMALAEIGSQIDLDEAANTVVKIQLLVIILVHVTVALIAGSKRKKIVCELVREFERSRTEPYTDDELYEHVREHIVITKKEMAKMLRSIKSNP